MGLFSRLHRDAKQETPCPRCGTPAPAGANECAACGWDLHEGYRSVAVGSHLEATDDQQPPPRVDA